LPSCPPGSKSTVEYFYNSGKTLDLLELDAKVEKVYIPRETPIDLKEEDKVRVLEKLHNIGNVDNPTYWKIGSAMQSAGYHYSDFLALTKIIRSHRPNEKADKQWKDSASREMGFGYLINLIKERCGDEAIKYTKEEKREYAIKKEKEAAGEYIKNLEKLLYNRQHKITN
jgi:hypothetical protein